LYQFSTGLTVLNICLDQHLIFPQRRQTSNRVPEMEILNSVVISTFRVHHRAAEIVDLPTPACPPTSKGTETVDRNNMPLQRRLLSYLYRPKMKSYSTKAHILPDGITAAGLVADETQAHNIFASPNASLRRRVCKLGLGCRISVFI
jgi:hypothetical protein